MSRDPRPLRSVRVEDDLWQQALTAAEKRSEPLSEAIRRMLRQYVARTK